MGSVLGGEGPLEEGLAIHSSVLAWRMPMGRGAWWAAVHGIAKSQTALKRHSTRIHLKSMKGKPDKLDIIKFLKFRASCDTIKKVKRQPTEQEKIFAKYT